MESGRTGQGVSNHKPRKGTETKIFLPKEDSSDFVSNHKPRKGTETTQSLPAMISVYIMFQITNPARGRKHYSFVYWGKLLYIVSNHKPRKGTETCHSGEHPFHIEEVSNHKPRKGTETFYNLADISEHLNVSNHKPRKGTETTCLRYLSTRVCVEFQITNPARGRKRPPFSTTLRLPFVSNHKPRKGTETPLLHSMRRVPRRVSNHKPRKGTETGYRSDVCDE